MHDMEKKASLNTWFSILKSMRNESMQKDTNSFYMENAKTYQKVVWLLL